MHTPSQNQKNQNMNKNGLPPKQGLYDPQFEHDSCGVGFVVNVKGKKSHEIIKQALTVLLNLDHRGACGCEVNTGDGAGILMQMPHTFLKKVCAKSRIDLPPEGQYGAGIVYLPPDARERKECEQIFGRIVAGEGQHVIGWRNLPTDNSMIGETAKASGAIHAPGVHQAQSQPHRRPSRVRAQAFTSSANAPPAKSAARAFRAAEYWYVASPSLADAGLQRACSTPSRCSNISSDLSDPSMDTALALVHSRFSTNTFPSWERGHPYRYVAHNGEINTLRGNINWMHARQSMKFESELLRPRTGVLPVINTNGSCDSAMFDNCLELARHGRTLPAARDHDAMIPEPWANHESMSDEKKAFYEYR